MRRTRIGEQPFTEEVTEMDETTRRWTDVTVTGPIRGTKGSWQVVAAGSGSRVQLTLEMQAVVSGGCSWSFISHEYKMMMVKFVKDPLSVSSERLAQEAE